MVGCPPHSTLNRFDWYLLLELNGWSSAGTRFSKTGLTVDLISRLQFPYIVSTEKLTLLQIVMDNGWISMKYDSNCISSQGLQVGTIQTTMLLFQRRFLNSVLLYINPALYAEVNVSINIVQMVRLVAEKFEGKQSICGFCRKQST